MRQFPFLGELASLLATTSLAIHFVEVDFKVCLRILRVSFLGLFFFE